MSTAPRRPPSGRFLGPVGIRYSPMRELPMAPDEPEMLDRIRHATSIRDEPECIGPAIVDGYASIASFHRSQQQALHVAEAQLIRPTLPPESRLSDLRRRAKASSVDMSHTLHIVERDIQKARMRSQPVPPRVLVKLESLEGLLDGIAA